MTHCFSSSSIQTLMSNKSYRCFEEACPNSENNSGTRHKARTESVCTSFAVVNKGDQTTWMVDRWSDLVTRVFPANCSYFSVATAPPSRHLKLTRWEKTRFPSSFVFKWLWDWEEFKAALPVTPSQYDLSSGSPAAEVFPFALVLC